MSNILKRTTLIVRDAEKSADWYSNVFGMKRWLDTAFTLGGIALAIGAAGDETHLVIMQCEDPNIGMLGLLQWIKPPLEMPPIPTKVTVGAPIFVIASDDSQGVFQRAKLSGVHIHSEPHEWSFTGKDGITKTFLTTSFFDLDGYFYEVNQLL
jgi:catechol 2,3-dioxygenase-like lactoylglutathione lyase family enzyme